MHEKTLENLRSVARHFKLLVGTGNLAESNGYRKETACEARKYSRFDTV